MTPILLVCMLLQPAPDIRVTVDVFNDSITPGEPVMVRAICTNHGEKAVTAALRKESGWFAMRLVSEGQPELNLREMAYAVKKKPTKMADEIYTLGRVLEPGSATPLVFVLSTPKNLPEGKYRLMLHWAIRTHGQPGASDHTGTLSSPGQNELAISVGPPDENELRRVARDLEDRFIDRQWKRKTVQDFAQAAARGLFGMDPEEAAPSWRRLAGTEQTIERNGVWGTIKPSFEQYVGLSERDCPEAVEALGLLYQRAYKNRDSYWYIEKAKFLDAFEGFQRSKNPAVARPAAVLTTLAKKND